jgi:predicted transcriptional regulator
MKHPDLGPLSICDALKAISDDDSLILFNTIALSSGDTDILITRLNLTRKQYYSRISKLINAGLMARKNRKYFLTSYGKVVYEAHMLIGMALQNYWKLKAIDSMLSDTNYEISVEERKRVIDTLIESDTIKEILGYKNLAPAKKEKIRNNQELIVSAISY